MTTEPHDVDVGHRDTSVGLLVGGSYCGQCTCGWNSPWVESEVVAALYAFEHRWQALAEEDTTTEEATTTHHTCTGWTATWCPTHGDCTCERSPDGDCDFDRYNCPLHGEMSLHADDRL